jgi:hypothetical protein
MVPDFDANDTCGGAEDNLQGVPDRPGAVTDCVGDQFGDDQRRVVGQVGEATVPQLGHNLSAGDTRRFNRWGENPRAVCAGAVGLVGVESGHSMLAEGECGLCVINLGCVRARWSLQATGRLGVRRCESLDGKVFPLSAHNPSYIQGCVAAVTPRLGQIGLGQSVVAGIFVAVGVHDEYVAAGGAVSGSRGEW